MPVVTVTQAFMRFRANMSEVDRLLQIHENISGTGPGRRAGLEVLNKSAIMLLAACWEAYLEDVARLALERMLRQSKDPRKFPSKMLAMAGKGIREHKDERKIWEIAGDGWKQVLRQHGVEVLKGFHTPRSEQVDQLFSKVLGLKNLSVCWKWQGMTTENARRKLDKLINIRGRIAHRVQYTVPVHKTWVSKYKKHITHLVRKTDATIRAYASRTTAL